MDNPSDQRSSCSIGQACRRYIDEWRLGMFAFEDTTGAKLSLEKTFIPAPKFIFGVVKFAILAWTLQVMVHSIAMREDPRYWLIFLTHWQVLVAVTYSLCSFLVHTKLLPISCDHQNGGQLNIYARLTWTLYVVGLNLAFAVSILFWVLEFDPSEGSPSYIKIMSHGGIFLLIFFDGMIINHTPIRLRQFIWYWAVCFLYLIWNIIHGYSPLGNPDKNSGDPATDDDAIYSVLNWKKRAGTAAIVSIGVLFVMTPILYHILWLVSKIFKSRYLEQERGGDGEEVVEEKEENGDEEEPKNE